MKLLKQAAITIVMILLSSNVFSQHNKYSVCEHIQNTGKTHMITQQLQALIDKCSSEGGGYIYFAAGEYLTGTLILKDNTFLELAPGATLYGSTDLNDYPVEGKNRKSLIYSDGANNIGIVGKGTINGQGDSFWRGKKKPFIRPDRFILFENSTNVKIEDVLVTNSANWTIEVRLCDGVWIDGISIINERKSPNSDGIDPVSSKNVFISNCYIETGDDGICPKSIGDIPNENLVVTNCIILSDDSAIKLGTRSETYIRDAVFSNIIIKDTEYGIAFYAKDGGTFENIRFNNIHIQSTIDMQADITKPMGTYPIFIDLEKRSNDSKLGAVKNIFFNNITIDSQDGHCVFFGQPDSKLQNIQLSDINFTLHQRKPYHDNRKPRGVSSLRDKADNDFSDAPSLFTFAHVDGLSIRNLTIQDLSDNKNNERHMIWGYDVHHVIISDLYSRQIITNEDLATLHFNESSSVEVKSCSPAPTNSSFIYLEGNNTKNIVLHNNNLLKSKSIVKFGGNFNPNELTEVQNILGK